MDSAQQILCDQMNDLPESRSDKIGDAINLVIACVVIVLFILGKL